MYSSALEIQKNVRLKKYTVKISKYNHLLVLSNRCSEDLVDIWCGDRDRRSPKKWWFTDLFTIIISTVEKNKQ